MAASRNRKNPDSDWPDSGPIGGGSGEAHRAMTSLRRWQLQLEDAEARLAAAERQLTAARTARDEVLVAAVSAGVGRAWVARVLGMSPGRVSQLLPAEVKQRGAAARAATRTPKRGRSGGTRHGRTTRQGGTHGEQQSAG